MPSWELFAQQPPEYREEVLPPTVRVRLGIEAASPFGWERWTTDEGATLAMTASARPRRAIGCSRNSSSRAERAAAMVRQLLAQRHTPGRTEGSR